MTQFPHKNRKLTAVFLLLILFFIVGANLAQNKLFPATNEKKIRLELLRNPTNSLLHEKLGQLYTGQSQEAAKREYILTGAEKNILGSEASDQIKYWEKVVQIHPNYLYAYLKLAQFNLQKGKIDKAKIYLEKVLREDPTNENAKKLLAAIK